MSQPINSTKQFLIAGGPLFLVLFIDGMGLGLIFPVLNALIMDPHSTFIAASTSFNMRNFIFGIIIGIFMLCWFFGAAFLGDLSDQIGRKKSLMICLLGSFLGYVFSAIGITAGSITLLILGRVIAGFTAGSQPIAQAAIVDISTEEHKARNIGWILFAVSAGFIFGPIIGGILSDNHFYSGFNYTTPFIFAAVISLINALLLQLLFQETFYQRNKSKVKIYRAVEIFISAFKHKKVSKLSIIFLIFILGWSSYYTFIGLFLLREYQFTALYNGLFMGLLGVGFGIGTGFFVEFCTKRYSLKRTVIVTMLLTALFVFATVTIKLPLIAWFCVIPIGGAVAVTYSVIITIFSNQVTANEQGWAMGITGALMAFGFGINGIFSGLIADMGPHVPLIAAVIGLIMSAFMMLYFYKENSILKIENKHVPF